MDRKHVMMKKEDEPIIVEEIYPVSAATVWSAITEAAQMRLWFFDAIQDFRPEVGFENS